MRKIFIVILILCITGVVFSQSKQNTMTKADKNNPLLCNPQSGTCEVQDSMVADSVRINISPSVTDKIRVVYFTDPICSSCWGIEPQLRKLKLEYGEVIDVSYHMGGLLPDWSYNSGGISKPSDVASHWDEVSLHYDMPIDGDVWLEDPLSSSYPPSIAFKAAQLQDKDKALDFLRIIREMVFLEKKNITRLQYMSEAASMAGLDTARFKNDIEGRAVSLFEEDLQLARTYGVRGFPTIFLEGKGGAREMVYGARPYAFYEVAVLKLAPNVVKQEYSKDWQFLFAKYSSLTVKEFAELSGMRRSECEAFLNNLVADGHLTRLTTKNGSIWRRTAK
ncbi:MAG TPA: DsbA family protein [Saprospiraceae bacterium]|nr:DsbA family protein [Saprospiraceae bacterium]